METRSNGTVNRYATLQETKYSQKEKKSWKKFSAIKKKKKIEPQQNNDFLIIVIIKAGGLGKKGQVKVTSLWEKHCKPEKIIWVI